MFLRDGAHDAFEHDALISGEQWIVDMVQIDFELARRVLLRNRTRFNTLRLAGRRHVPDHLREGVHFRHAVDLRSLHAFTADRRYGRLGTSAGKSLPIEDIELKLESDDGAQSQFPDPFNGFPEDISRLEGIGGAIAFAECHHDLPRRLPRPGHRFQRARYRFYEAIGITVGETHAERIVVLANRIEEENGAGRCQALRHELAEEGHGIALAPANAAEIRIDHIYRNGIRVAGQVVDGLLRQLCARIRHDIRGFAMQEGGGSRFVNPCTRSSVLPGRAGYGKLGQLWGPVLILRI